MFFHIAQFLAYIPLKILYPTRFYGRKNLLKGIAVLCVNHTSNQDAPLLAANLFEKKYFLAKQELFSSKFKASVMKFCGGIPINRQKPTLEQIKTTLGILKSNKKLVVFPEGTRVKDKVEQGEMGETKNGAAMFAIKSKAPVIPVWYERKPRLFRLTKVYIGEPFELTEFYDKKLDENTLNEAGKIISTKLLELGKKDTNGKI
jgi:1-acyl-sn-glycerol-3-phosphate acyltransferase